MKKILLLFGYIFLSQIAYSQKFDELAGTPPMGWNSWNRFGCEISENIVKENADAMVSSGMKDAGYEYIVIDDCWQIDRDENGNIIADPEKFPSGIKALADYVHSKGLKFGLYSDAGTLTCNKRPGSRGYEFQDARIYASWGVDYLKYDWCNHGKQLAEPSYITMRDAIYRAGRPMIFSICEWGTTEPWKWAKDVGHLWRTTHDINNCFDYPVHKWKLSVLEIVDKQIEIRKYSGPGHWNDPDMLQIGNGVLTTGENRAHFSMWCMLAAPLMAGNDLRTMSKEIIEILTNKEVISVDQDPLGIPALLWRDYGDFEIWFKPLQNGNMAICFLNRSTKPYELNYELKNKIINDLDFGGKKYEIGENYRVRDLWKHKDIGTTAMPIKATIPGHDVLMIKLFKPVVDEIHEVTGQAENP